MKTNFNSELLVRFHGVRGSIPSPGPANLRYGGNTSCVEVRRGEDLLILDAGSGLRSLGTILEEEAPGQPIAGALLLSHTHWDHIQGLPFFTPGYRPENHFQILAGPGQAGRVEQGLRNQMGPLHFPVRLAQMSGLSAVEELGQHHAVGSFSIRIMPLNHPGGCTGFRIEACGRSIAYLPDHEPNDSGSIEAESSRRDLIAFIQGVDLLILDTQYTAEEYALRRGWGHGSLPESVDLALAANVRELALYHHDPAHSDIQIDAMVAMARQRAAGTALVINGAAEGNVLTFPRLRQNCAKWKTASLKRPELEAFGPKSARSEL